MPTLARGSRVSLLLLVLLCLTLRARENGASASSQAPPSAASSGGSQPVAASWEDEAADERLLHLTIDDNSGQKRVYVGATNKLYQLSSDLKLEAVAHMGPMQDSDECPVTRRCPYIELKPTNYYNKALIIYNPNYLSPNSPPPAISTTITTTHAPIIDATSFPVTSQLAHSNQQSSPSLFSNQGQNPILISCGTLFQGSCALHNLHNITEYYFPANESIVSNDAAASSFVFIAPGPTKQFQQRLQQPVLYVGASSTGKGPYNNEVPAVSSRSLQPESMFQVAGSNVVSGTKMMINSLLKPRFPINYIYGFSSRGFSYFLTVQRKSTSTSKQPFVSKLVRICQKDMHYHSYVEVPLVCRTDNGFEYNLAQAAYVGHPGLILASFLGIKTTDDVLYVVFSKSKENRDIHNEPSQQSALCIYALPSVHLTFTQNIQHCFNGNGEQGLDYVNPTVPCIQGSVIITEDFCGLDVNNPIGGQLPIETSPVIEYKNTSLTAVAASPTNDFTVVFLGTSTGQLKKLIIEDPKFAVEYSTTIVDPVRRTPINSDMRFDRTDKTDFIYVMNDKKVSLIKVQECNTYKTCGECLGTNDPHCGWCSLENRCSIKSSCNGAQLDSLYWLSYKSGRCTTITNVTPHQIQKTTTRTLSLAIDNLPNVEGNFLCGFSISGRTEFTNATKSSTGVTCPTPATEALIPLSTTTTTTYSSNNHHDLVTKLSVRMNNGPDFTATNFTFFDCSSYTTCTECVSSPYPCDWCVAGHRCTHDTGENCRNDILVTGLKQKGQSSRPGPKYCPRVNTTHGSSELLVSAGQLRRIQVLVHEIPPVISNSKFACQFNLEGRVLRVAAKLLDDSVYCDEMEFTYTTITPNMTASLAIIWDNSKPLDNPSNVHILVYQCAAMADNCGFCLELPEKYSCGWCKDSNTCLIRDHCSSQGQSSFLLTSDTCPNPQILSFEPTSGPHDGGTNLTIRGINLGRSFDDIQNAISLELYDNDNKLGQIPCNPYREYYVRTSQIICQLASPASEFAQRWSLSEVPYAGLTLTGVILVRVTNDHVARSLERFRFVNPRIVSIIPSKGPKSGGTKLVLWGLDMDAGSRAEVNVGSFPCIIISRTTEKAECITTKAERAEGLRVSIRFDNGEQTFHDYSFLYVEDPEVDIVTSVHTSPSHLARVGSSHLPPPKGIPAGGITIHVRGKNFISIQQPRFYVLLDGIKYNSTCVVENATEITCLSPYVPDERLAPSRLSHEEPVELDYGFWMDNVDSVHNLATRRNNPLPMFLMYSDPEYKPFPEKIKFYHSDYLTINGSNLDRASSENDITVKIGKGVCNVTSLSRTQLTCKPPQIQPEALNWRGQFDKNQLPDVVVTVGHSLNFTIGKISYDTYEGLWGLFPRSVLIVLVLAACILMFTIVTILIAYKRKANESNRVVKSMQEQMDVLEMKVASEAKQAFTELQTEMTDLTDDLEHGGIPYLDYRIYAMKVLFPNSTDHAVLKEMQIVPNMEKGLALFGQLILNKTFVLLFIRTLESNRYFSMRDRVNVASLLMVTLQNRMEYCTDVLKTLLADLIERSMESRSHPKLLLRRTESVAEKMLSSWFTFLLYKFLRECAGEPLFLMYQAIKHQVNKGPVDVITSEARCSLSEEKLIRHSVDYKPLTVFVCISPQTAYLSGVDPNLQTDNIKIPVKVLDCDTISQVKEKAIDTIYKSTPYSQRPYKDHLELEWRASTTARVIMSDEDHTTKIEGCWKRLNTLAHYKVPDNAILNLVTKQTPIYNLGLMDEKHRYETLSQFGFPSKNGTLSPLSRPTSPLNGYDRGNFKYWHLVRHPNNDYRDGERSAKMVSEIYLTRLLATKGTLQRFVDDLFETIFSTARLTSSLPIAIKYMFDFLDDQARVHGITDPEVVHTWKSNSLPLRFWVNLIKNPNFVFDINKSNIVDSCLSVVAQTFMDACSTSEHRLGKDSPSSKLLYAKDLPIYKDWVERYYNEIAMIPPINDHDMNAMLAEESRQHAHEFNSSVSLNELFKYALKYQEQLMLTLDEDEFGRKFKLAAKLRQTMLIMNVDNNVLLQV